MKVEAIKVEDGFLIPFNGTLEKIETDKIWLEVEIIDPDEILTDAEFEAIADQLADEFIACAGQNPPSLSDYAVSREGIYEEHP